MTKTFPTPNMYRHNLGLRLHKYRERMQLSRKELANKLDIDFVLLSDIEDKSSQVPIAVYLSVRDKLYKLQTTDKLETTNVDVDWKYV